MEKNEPSDSEIVDALNILTSDLGLNETIELVNAIEASRAYFNDLDEETPTEPNQDFQQKCLYIAYVLDTVLRAGQNSTNQLLENLPFAHGCCSKYSINLDLLSPLPQEKFISSLNKILNEDYQIPCDNISLMKDIHAIGFAYLCGGASVKIPTEVRLKLDLAAFRLIFALGQFHSLLIDYPRKIRHKVRTKLGKEHQGSKTKGIILEAYKAIGAEWKDDEPLNLPILSRGARISVNKLAGELFIHLKGTVTQRHINNCLKELHEKGEI